ncbi:short-chain dehydrogenase, partial [Xylella fastidiosa subsp. multiplex]|nr:short-chain dehydrogenase [Xylella fastidiosa subsp. multiplex]
TQRLLPLLRKAVQDQPAGAVRILNTASDASEMIPSINLDDMQNLERFSPGMAYCTGKLANVLFARALADRLAGEGIVAHAVHP